MAKKSGYTPNPRRSREMIAAIDGAVLAAADRMADKVVEYWEANIAGSPGYTSGEYATGRAQGSVGVSGIVRRGRNRVAYVYSTANRDGEPYPAFWELGHINVFTGRYERVEIFRPALMQAVDEVARAFAVRFTQIAQSPFFDTLFSQSGGLRVSG